MTFLLLPSIKFLLQAEKYQMEVDSALLKKEQGSHKCTGRKEDIRDFFTSQTQELSKPKCRLCFNGFLVQSSDKIQLN